MTKSHPNSSDPVGRSEPLEEEEIIVAVDSDGAKEDKLAPKTNRPSPSPMAAISEHETFSQRWSSAIDTVRILICRAIKVIAHWSATHPWTTIVAITVISLGMIVLGITTNFYVETNGDILWPPQGSTTAIYQEWIESESSFSNELDYSVVYVHRHGENLLEPGRAKQALEKVFEVYEAIINLETKGGEPGFEDICGKPYTDPKTNLTSSCDDFGVIEFWNAEYALFRAKVSNDQEAIEQISASTFPNGKTVDPAGTFGGAVYDDSTNLLTRVEAYRLDLVYPIHDATTEFLARVTDTVLELGDEVYSVEILTTRSFDDEFQVAIVKDIPLMPMAFTVMSIFCCIVFGRRDRVRSQALVGFGAVVTVLFSIFTGYGLMFLCGIPLTSATQIVVFVMFGIGLDDAFIISGSYSRTDPKKDPVERIADTVDDIGLSIAITTLTSALAFATGCISSIRAVYWLCLYAFPTILIDFIYQISIFIAIVVIDERRMQRNKMDCLVCVTVSREDNEEDDNNDNTNLSEGESVSLSSRFMDAYARKLLQPGVKAAVLVVFTALFGACIWGTTQLKQEMDFADLVPKDSFVKSFFDVQDEYFNAGLQCATYFRDVDHSDPAVRAEMDAYVNTLLTEGIIMRQPPYFWVRDFADFVASHNGTEAATFNEQMDAFLANPLYKTLYGDSIIRDSVTNDVLHTRVWTYMDIDLGDSRQLVERLALIRDVDGSEAVNKDLPEGDYSFFVYDKTMNMWEFNAVVPKELTFTTVTGVVAVSIIGLAFVPHWTAIFFILPSILTVYIDLLGFLHFVGVRINPVSYITLVMSIGLLVDFIIHPLLRFYECKTGNREDRVRETLRTMGSSILIGGVSTFLGVMLLAFSTSTIFSTIFRAFIGMVLLGLAYGLILLPVVLSIVGPEVSHESSQATTRDVVTDKTDEPMDVTATDFVLDSSQRKSPSPVTTKTEQTPPLLAQIEDEIWV